METLFSLQDKPLILCQQPKPIFTVRVVAFGLLDFQKVFEDIRYNFKTVHIEYWGVYVYDLNKTHKLKEDISALQTEIASDDSVKWFVLGLDHQLFSPTLYKQAFKRPAILSHSDRGHLGFAHVGFQQLFKEKEQHAEDEMSLLDLTKEIKDAEPLFRMRKEVYLSPSVMKQFNFSEDTDSKRVLGFSTEEVLKIANYLGFSMSLTTLIWSVGNKLEEKELKLLFSHFLWYFCNGLSEFVSEDLNNKSMYEVYEIMNEERYRLLKNKITGRWWKQMSDSEKQGEVLPTFAR